VTESPELILSFVPAFWKRFGSTVPKEHQVFYLQPWTTCTEVVDVHGAQIPGLGPLAGKIALFFIDQDPQANWEHRCCYLLMAPDGGFAKADHVWPPSDELHLTKLERENND
jgi:hypothetical protein